MDVDVVIIGGGVIGLSCAAESTRRGFSTLVVERHDSIGNETSSRNSEVVHSGMYYPTGSLKARLCVAGNASLYKECDRLGVWYNNCGKLVVATAPEEEPELDAILARGIANGVNGLRMLSQSEALEFEPNIRCRTAIYVPSTGVVDSHELMKAFMTEARQGGGEFVFNTRFLGADRDGSGYRLRFADAAGEESQLCSRFVVNSAGLSADRVAAAFGIDIDTAGYRLHPNRGHYYRVSGGKSKLVSRLVYPVPFKKLTGLGVHITIDRAGQCKLGPDAEYLDPSVPESEWYKFDDSRADKFFESVVRYFPALERQDLSPDQVGVRPKLQGPGDPVKDFIINEESAKGLSGLVNLIGIESPGLTCCVEIAKETFRLIDTLN